jgi:hypothetical protein
MGDLFIEMKFKLKDPLEIQAGQKVSVHLMITVQKTSKNILNSSNHSP